MGELKLDMRRKRILELLSRDGQVFVSRLSAELHTSPVTIRGDLDALELDGYLERVQGGAIQTVQNFYNLEFQRRKQDQKDAKRAVAEAVAKLVKDGDTLLINSGTTTYYTAMALKKHKNLNIVTNSLAVSVELGGVPSFRVILLGGDINAQYSFTYGADAQEQLQQYKADRAILSMDGVCEQGVTTYHAEEAVIDRMMIQRAKQTLIAADSSKLNHEGFSLVCGLDKLHTLVTDGTCTPLEKKKWEELGLEVVRG